MAKPDPAFARGMKGSPMTVRLYEYVVHTFGQPERELLATMANRAQEAGMPLIMIGEDQATFLRFFLPTIRAKRCLDVGTLFGYSAAVMALATAPDGTVVSLELEPRHAEVARANWKAARVADRIEVRVGPAVELMKSMPSDSFDFALIDADKGGYIRYFEEALRLVRAGGVIAADNTLAWGLVAEPATGTHTSDIASIQAFNEHVAKRTDVDACLLPLGDGLLLARVKD